MGYQNIIEEIADTVKSLFGQGKVADYIPALAKVPPNKLGIAIETIGGLSFCTGDAEEQFSIQSISKVIALAMAYPKVGEQLWERVGIEPSGNPFNSLVQLEYERGIPRNPFINAGALVITDLLIEHFPQPKNDLLQLTRQLAQSDDIYYDYKVAASERELGYTNAALVNFMKSHYNIKAPVENVLDVYFHQCSLAMSCRELARAFLMFANHGIIPHSGERILTESQAKRLNALMLTCGFYDEAGEFAFRVGLPGKSGVGGGIVAVIPGELAIAVWSPELNEHGNSLVGIKVLELFTTLTGKSIF
ncbi:glutaminase [Phaeodactylibacter luteus]|uniref:Glutaminase n=1 Tax=Phaeodactylibacter luteus TaxID=1564516 RepID=A0A5C6RZU6_9BACT|nr:glutaminase [Phaeodactylibacter luteus]TXB67623.1 glutaminase [Phaeodactylibacter luteus]